MTYTLNWSDPNLKVPSAISLDPLTIDNITTDLSLFGKGAQNYGQGQQQNFIRMLENFCSETQPPHPTIGQLWYDRGANQLKIRQYDGTSGGGALLSSWKVVGGATVAPTSPPGAKQGDLWYDTSVSSSPLNYYDGLTWVPVADGNTLAAHASDYSLHISPAQNTLLDNIESSITSGEILALDGITSNIQGQLDALTTAGGSNATGLTNEISARTTADTALSNAIAAEALTRSTNDDNNFTALTALANTKVAKAGDSMSGYLTLLSANPSATYHAVPKIYLDNSIFNAFASMSGASTVIYQREYETAASAPVNQNFTLPVSPTAFGPYTVGSNDLSVFVGGIKQIKTVNYTEAGVSAVNFTVPLSIGTMVTFERFILGGGLNSPSTAAIASIKQVSYTATANQTTFSVPAAFTNVIGGNVLFVWVNGVKQIANVGATQYAYAETTTTIVFNTLLPSGTTVELVGLNLTAPANVQRNVLTATTAGQTQFLLNPSINTAINGTWTFVNGVFQGKSEAAPTPNGYAVNLASGVVAGSLVEIFGFNVS